MALSSPSLLALRKDAALQRLPPALSLLCVLIGVLYFLLLPLNEYSRSTYISENALLPGQVHTYFHGSEQNVFNAYRHEVQALDGKPQEEKSTTLRKIFETSGLKVATQKYNYKAGGNIYGGENVYAVLQAPRGDATEAIVLVAAWRNMDDEFNLHGVALALTLSRYFKRWSLWSKDIIFLITSDSKAGPQAWIEAYHDGHNPAEVDSLPLKSGALEGAIVVDNPLDHRFETLHISYDGINGQLPNLDLFNTAVAVSRGQHGIGAALQKMWTHQDTYFHRLKTMLRGMANQGLGHASGPHSSFIPYHVDAITIRATGNGWQDDMALGRVVESLFRSLNNLMEHFHQSFFLYILMQTNRFVSIGTYLPSAMLVAANFTIMAIALWILSGKPPSPPSSSAPIKAENPPKNDTPITDKKSPDFELVTENGMTAAIPTSALEISERPLLLPIALVLALHFLGVIPLYLFNRAPQSLLLPLFYTFLAANNFIPIFLKLTITHTSPLSHQQRLLVKCFSMLFLGMFLATLATINFSLSFLVGLLSAPLTFVGPSPGWKTVEQRGSAGWWALRGLEWVAINVFSPPVAVYVACHYAGIELEWLLMEAAFGWRVWGLWTQVIVWCVWWPAWLVAALDVAPGL